MWCVHQSFVLLGLTRERQISWSGCKDSQTSADTQEAGNATGAMSYVRPLLQGAIRWPETDIP